MASFSPNITSTGARRPYLYPIIGPTGAGMTRNWPMKEGMPGEEPDHLHHKGLWFGHRHVNGAGFWENSAKADAKLGQIVHDEFRGGERRQGPGRDPREKQMGAR